MNTLTALALTLSSPRVTSALSEAAGKSFLILAAALMAARLLRRSAAAVRHFVWLAALASLLALPAATILAPHWNGPAWADALAHQGAAAFSGNDIPASVTGPAPVANTAKPAAEAPRIASPAPTAQTARPFSWRALVLPGWAAGVVLMMLILLARHGQLRRLEHSARPVTNPEILGLHDSVLRELGLRRKVRLLESGRPLMPMTWGCRRPAALLPSDAVNWEPERLRLVLRHELAHVRRVDCLTQALADVVCALYWFNPLTWLAAGRMRVERERACDDLVVAVGHTRPSEYAGHLLDLARRLSAAPRAALPVAKRSGLDARLRALLDGSNHHGGLTRGTAVAVACTLAAGVVALAGWRVAAAGPAPDAERQQLIVRVEEFSAMKEKQALQLAAVAGEQIIPECQAYFEAAIRGDGTFVTNQLKYFMPRYDSNNVAYANMGRSYLAPVMEIDMAYSGVMNSEPDYVREFADGIITSIPRGGIYFGGTDPGRGLVTLFCKSQPEGDPFFTLTQNGLADSSYLEYLRRMYGGKIYIPTTNDLQTAFQDYMTDLQERMAHNQLKPGEQVTNQNGNMQVSGQTSVMAINGLLARMIFDQNPDKEFYLEESFPLDWTYPYLEPHGLILKINRTAQPALSAEIARRDQDFWQAQVDRMLGGWLRPETPLQTVIDFADKTDGRHDLAGFTGDPRFIHDIYSQKMFSKLRLTIAGVYAWRGGELPGVPTPADYLAPPGPERQRMIAAADLAFRQAFALCPCSMETVTRYVQFLMTQGRHEDAISLCEAALRQPGVAESNNTDALARMLEQLKKRKVP